MDTPQTEMIVEKELGQDYNPEDEGIVFIDIDSESDRNYDTQDCIFHDIKKEHKQFFSFKAISDIKIFGLQKISDASIFRYFFVRKVFCPTFFALYVALH